MNPKKQKPGLVDLRPGNKEGLFRFRRFINLSLTYLLGHIPTYLQPQDPGRYLYSIQNVLLPYKVITVDGQ